jgi:hypothetical protein
MNRMVLAVTSLVVATSIPLVQAQQSSVATGVTASTELSPQTAFGALTGRWVRLEGGYVISIKAVDAGGKLEASYANPSPLPFYTAVATSDGDALKLFFELRAGGYGGSTYTLSYDKASDQLRGIYYQAVAKQKFEVVFVRAKS